MIAIGESRVDELDDELKGWIDRYEHVGSVTNVEWMTAAVRWIQQDVWVDRIEATVEAHTMPVAEVRERCGIPGTSTRTAWLCRDKPTMKDVLRDAGVATAASAAISTPDEARDFAEQVGFPLILKPRDGAGASGTTRVDDDAGLESALVDYGDSSSIAIEEFVTGHEGFYDTICHDGHVVHDFVSHYYPGVLEAMRTRWISPQFLTTNRLDEAPDYAEVRAMGREVIAALGIGTSATHMEWFFGPKGLRFSEIGCRPPGVGAWDLYGAGNDVDLYREWAHVIVHGTADGTLSRRASAGIIALRPDQDGHITGYSGVDEAQDRYGEWVLDAHFPAPGTPTQSPAAGYMANAWVRMQHSDYDTLRGMLDDVGRTIQVHAN